MARQAPRTSRTTGPQGRSEAPTREAARVDLPSGRGLSARSLIRQLGRLARRLPDRVSVVVVSVPSAEALTVELLTAIAISRRSLAIGGRDLILKVPGEPPTASAAALLNTMPFVLRTADSSTSRAWASDRGFAHAGRLALVHAGR